MDKKAHCFWLLMESSIQLRTTIVSGFVIVESSSSSHRTTIPQHSNIHLRRKLVISYCLDKKKELSLLNEWVKLIRDNTILPYFECISTSRWDNGTKPILAAVAWPWMVCSRCFDVSIKAIMFFTNSLKEDCKIYWKLLHKKKWKFGRIVTSPRNFRFKLYCSISKRSSP